MTDNPPIAVAEIANETLDAVVDDLAEAIVAMLLARRTLNVHEIAGTSVPTGDEGVSIADLSLDFVAEAR